MGLTGANESEALARLCGDVVGVIPQVELTLHVGILLLLLGDLRLNLREFTLLLPPLVEAGHQHDRQNSGDDQDDEKSRGHVEATDG